MKKLIFVFLSLFIFSTITLPEPSLAATQQKKTTVKSLKKKVVKQKKRAKVRYSHHINKPQEGDLLKLEGMVKDLNEQ
ncbi:hypothetical protein THERU_00225 [Thermocrinis ruber]|uniref:Uncharacterized protein n=1 Tax=Thermocrinis ruber TaxID=75906 RepID=W0DE77_9AQUI|nr:hypothetical protein [Thermocrinis ruber]AHE95333.1 hypothetical protein THERU_00225 [Thermocrinis ruber]